MLSCAVMPALAATENGEDLFFSDIPVVLSVSRLTQSQADAPGAVTVIDRDMIRMSGARDVSDLLRLVPGFQVTPPNQDAARVVYHGLSEEYPPRTQVLIDGRSQYSPLFLSGVNWNQLPVALEDIERIEVIRGSNSAAYGSNAFLGVINIITLDPSQTRGTLLKVQAGNNGLLDGMVRVGGGGDSYNYRLTARHNFDKGLATQDDNRYAQNFEYRGDWQLTDRDILRFFAGRARSDVLNGKEGRPSNPLRHFGQHTDYVQVDWQRAMDPSEDVQVRYFLQREWGSDRHLEYSDNSWFDVDYGGRSQRHDIEVQHTFRPWQDARLAWGGGWRGDEIRHPFFFGTDATLHRGVERIFGNLEWRFRPDWLLNAGGTWEHDSLSGTTFAPRASLNYRLRPDHTVRTVLSRAYRTPSNMDMRGHWSWLSYTNPNISDNQWFGNPSLKPERIDSLELGYVGEFKPERLSVDLRVFDERITNRLLVQPVVNAPGACENSGDVGYGACGRVDNTMNFGTVTNRGLEYQLRWQPLPSTRLIFNQAFLRVSATQYDGLLIADSASRIAELTGKAIAAAPTRNTSFMWMQQLPYGFEMSAMWYQMTGVRWTVNTRIGEYQRVDWRLAYPFRRAGKSGEVAYTVQSANGNHDEFRPGQNMTPKHWLSLKLEM
jgi:iron complex outermembrane receptor protein